MFHGRITRPARPEDGAGRVGAPLPKAFICCLIVGAGRMAVK